MVKRERRMRHIAHMHKKLFSKTSPVLKNKTSSGFCGAKLQDLVKAFAATPSIRLHELTSEAGARVPLYSIHTKPSAQKYTRVHAAMTNSTQRRSNVSRGGIPPLGSTILTTKEQTKPAVDMQQCIVSARNGNNAANKNVLFTRCNNGMIGVA